MARPRTASNILEARGAFRINPNRARVHEPKPGTQFPDAPPDSLDDAERSCWVEIVSICPAGVLTGSDTLAVEVLSSLLAEFRVKRAGMDVPRMTKLMMMMSKLGLDPSGRASLVVPKSDRNEFDDV